MVGSPNCRFLSMGLRKRKNRITRGQLPGYRDHSVKKTKHARRVRRSSLHTLVDETSDHVKQSISNTSSHPHVITRSPAGKNNPPN
jgi:hypothetical protein